MSRAGGARMDLSLDLSVAPELLVERLVDFIREKVSHLERDGVVFGVSGGIDSAVICALSARAVGPERCLGLIIPERDSEPQSTEDGRLVAEAFGVRTKVVDLTAPIEFFGAYDLVPEKTFSRRDMAKRIVRIGYKMLPQDRNPFFGGLLGVKVKWLRGPTAYYRIKHRLRSVAIYYCGEIDNLLIVGSSNKTENLTGFFVKYGDSSADIMPLAGLYKSQVRKLARHLLVPDRVVDKPSSPDLIPGITDELALGLSYEKLDLILYGLEKGMSSKDIARNGDVSVRRVEYVRGLVRRSEHMRSLPMELEV